MRYTTLPFLIYGRVPFLHRKMYAYNIFNSALFIEDKKIINRLALHPNALGKRLQSQLEQAGFLYKYGHAPVYIVNRTKTFTIWLHLTNTCNLSCPYCFVRKEKPEMVNPNITLNYIHKIVRDVKKHGYKKLKIKYSGGEPLLPAVFNLLKRIHKGLTQIVKIEGLELEEVIISNGTLLTEEVVAFLAKNNMHIAVSLDGWGNTHNKTRKTIGGQPTFNIILNNINHLLNYNVKFNISVVVHKYNLQDIEKLLLWAYDKTHPISVKLNFVRDNPYAVNNVVPSFNKLIKSLKKAYTLAAKIIIKRNHTPGLLNALLDYIDFSYPKNFTCEAGRSYMVLKADGTISTCHMRLNYKDVNINSSEDVIETLSSIGIPKRISVDEKPGCKDCPIRYICGGGCPILTNYIYKTYNRPSFYCPVYKELAPFLLGLIAYVTYKQAGKRFTQNVANRELLVAF